MLQPKTRRRQFVVLCVLLVWLVLGGAAVLFRQSIEDWWKLRGYTPPTAIANIAHEDTMTTEARHLFYVNKPEIVTGEAFTSKCPAGGEKTVVLGCYVGNDGGIYVYDVTDTRLNGVIQVTAAHEMLHAAYARLSGSEKTRVDQMLSDYYDHQLQDQRIKDTIAAYKQSEPTELLNEMHSIFGTEVANLPAGLEDYYAQYFQDRAVIAGYTAQYKAEFTSRQQQVAAYDAQLASLKETIDANETELESQKAALDAQAAALAADSQQNIAAYNQKVREYNQAVNEYNALLRQTKNLIDEYNTLVDKRNQIALEEQQLVQALSPQSLPSSQ